MLNLMRKDYLFTKKIMMYTILYCIAVPLILLLDQDGKIYFADLLIPLALVTAPLTKLMNAEDSKSGVIFQKTLPYTSYEKVGGRYLFVFSLLFLGNLYLSLVKVVLFGAGSFLEAFRQSVPVFVGFAVYYVIYLTVFYWKGYFASQFCVYFLVFLVVFGKRLLTQEVMEVVTRIASNRILVSLVLVGILAVFYVISCSLDEQRKIDR